RDLYWWHPLVSGDPETVHLAGISVRGRTVSEAGMALEDYENHLVDWPGERPDEKDGLPVLVFRDQPALEAWLEENHGHTAGAWIRIAKAGSDARSVSCSAAVDAALPFGWIE